MTKYRLGDYTVQNWNDWDRVPRDPATISAAIITATGASGVAATLITIGVSIGVSMVTSWVISALSPKPDFGSLGSAGLLVNSRDASAPQDFIYGKVRKGGVVTFAESTGDENKYLHQIIMLAGHEVDAIDSIYIDDGVVSLDSNGFVTGDTWNSKVRVLYHLGAQTATTDDFANATGKTLANTLLDESELSGDDALSSSFVGEGLAYLYVRYEYDQDTFANGIPLITATIRGKKVYDPRSDTTAYSNNAALCVRDFIASAYGLGDNAIDDVAFAAAANECDENITLSGGGSEKRYAINGVVRSDRAIGDVLQDMATSCAGMLFWGSGYWKLKVGAYTSPVKTLTLDDLRGPISLDTRISMRDNFNTVRGTFIDADQDWISTDFPAIESQAFKDEDGGEEVSLDLTLPYTTSAATAQRLAKLTLFRGREQMTLSAEFGLNAFDIEVGDIIAFTNDRYGFDEKEFEVIGWQFAANQDAGDLRVALTLRETSEAAFDWNAEEQEIIGNNTNLPVFNSVSAPTNLQLSATSTLNDDGISIPAIRATWSPSTNAFVQYYEIQYKRLGGEEDYGSIAVAQDDAEDWGSITVTATSEEDYGLTNEEILTPDADYTSVFGSSQSFTIEPVLNGYDYQVRVRAISGLGVRSPFVTAQLASAGDTTPPNEPLGFTATAGYKANVLKWTNPADQDLSFIEVWANDLNNLSTATLIGETYSNTFTEGGLSNNDQRYYWVRAVDLSLNKSDFVGPQDATTLLIAPNDFNDAVNDLFQEAGAFGIEPVSTLPASGDFDGQLVLLLSDITIYRWDDATSSWSTDIYTGSAVEEGSITYTSFASGIEPVGVVGSLPTVSGYEGPQVVVLTTDGKLYRLVDDEWTAAVNTDDIEGTIGANLFSDDLRPVERVTSLPSTGLTQGRIVLLTSDNKLYRYTGSAWTAAVPATDVTGQITGTQISDNAVTASKINANAVTADKINANAVTADKISASAVSADKIAANAVNASKIAADAITADKIAANAVDADAIAANSITTGKIAAGAVSASEIAADAITSDKIFAGAVTADAIATDAITADKIAASSIISSKIASGAVTASKISVSELSAISADLGTIQVDTANIANGAITNAKINDLSADKITAGSISADFIQIDDVTLDTSGGDLIIKTGGVNTAQVASNAITNVGATTVASASTGSFSYVTIATVTFTGTAGAQVLTEGYATYVDNGGGESSAGFGNLRLVVNGSVVYGPVPSSGNPTLIAIFSAISGTNTVQLQINKQGGDFNSEVENIGLYAIQLKR